MEIKVLGIAGSPVKKGNLETFMTTMLKTVSPLENVTTETIFLSGLEINDCKHCNFCINKQKKGKYCSINDDAQLVFDKVETADVLLLATPVYFTRMSGLMASMIDRLRVFIFGNEAGAKLKDKVGVSAAVAWGRNAGFETTHLSMISTFLLLEMIPTSVHHCASPLGASAVASEHGLGQFKKEIRLGVEQDLGGLHSADVLMKRAVELATIIKKGKAAL